MAPMQDVTLKLMAKKITLLETQSRYSAFARRRLTPHLLWHCLATNHVRRLWGYDWRQAVQPQLSG
jgi:hypothetical protein